MRVGVGEKFCGVRILDWVCGVCWWEVGGNGGEWGGGRRGRRRRRRKEGNSPPPPIPYSLPNPHGYHPPHPSSPPLFPTLIFPATNRTAEVQNRQLNSHTPISKSPTATTATTATMTMMRPVNKKIVGIAIVYIYTQKYIRVPKERKATLPSPARSAARVAIKKVIYNHLCMYG